MSNETRLKFLLTMVKKVPVENQIKFFKEIGFSGTLANLKQILPLNQYQEESVQITARGASLKIILRAFEQEQEIASLDIEIFRKVLEQLERNCGSMTEADFANLERLRERIQKTAGMDVARTIPFDVAKAGMVLAKPVHNQAGMVLMGEGTSLDQEVMLRLEEQDVYWLTIKMDLENDPEIPPVIKKPDERTEKISAELNHRFQGLEGSPEMNRIKNAALRFLVSRKEPSQAVEPGTVSGN